MTGDVSARTAVLRIARTCPHLSRAEIARRAGCHPSTAGRHLRVAPTGRAVAAAAGQTFDMRIMRNVSPAHPAASVTGPELLRETCAAAAAARPPSSGLHLFARHSAPAVRREAAANAACPPDTLARLSADPVHDVRQRAAGSLHNRRCVVVCRDREPEVRAAAASTVASAELLRRLAFDRAPVVRAAAARNPNCPPATLERLTRDDDSSIMVEASLNPNCPPAALVALAACDDPTRRQAAAGHSDCPAGVLSDLAADESWGVRIHVANNPACPPALLEQLAVDVDPSVSGAATRKRNHQLPQQLSSRGPADAGQCVHTAKIPVGDGQ